jgi:hypothetical protein
VEQWPLRDPDPEAAHRADDPHVTHRLAVTEDREAEAEA